MKRCPNTNCGSSFLYGNDKTVCPFCHSALVENGASGTGFHQPMLPPDRVVFEEPAARNEAGEFIRESFGCMECHGRIIEIDHHELFHSGWHKLFNSLFRGEPYQFGHQTIEYTIRVENITNGFPAEVTDFCLYGSYLGRLQVGDEVMVRAKRGRNRRVAKAVYNETTGSRIRPGLQLPAGFVRVAVLMLLAMIVSLVCEVVWLFTSGAVMAGIVSLIDALMPAIIVCVGIWLLFRSIFPRRRF